VRSLDERAASFQQRMVGELIALGITDESVLQVMATVPRHRFVDQFWAVSPGASAAVGNG
jgi:protein-L-isoaspartate O-methyltransferase